MKHTTVTVNDTTWTEDPRRAEKGCGVCKAPTRGRIKKEPCCMNCAMKTMMQPIASIAAIFKELFS